MPLHVSNNMCSSPAGQNCIIQTLVSSHLYWDARSAKHQKHDNCSLGFLYKWTIIDASVKYTSRGTASLYGDQRRIIYSEVQSSNNNNNNNNIKSNESFATKFWKDYVSNSNFTQPQNAVSQEMFGSITKGTWAGGNNDSFVMYSSSAVSWYYSAMKTILIKEQACATSIILSGPEIKRGG